MVVVVLWWWCWWQAAGGGCGDDYKVLVASFSLVTMNMGCWCQTIVLVTMMLRYCNIVYWCNTIILVTTKVKCCCLKLFFMTMWMRCLCQKQWRWDAGWPLLHTRRRRSRCLPGCTTGGSSPRRRRGRYKLCPSRSGTLGGVEVNLNKENPLCLEMVGKSNI